MSESSPSQFGDNWALARGTWDDDLPISMRIRLDIDDYVASPQFPVGYRITRKFDAPNERGQPSAEDMDLMELFEEKLVSAFESSGTAIIALIVTHNGERDYSCYTADPDATHALFNETFSSEPLKPLSFSSGPDPEWQEYLTFRTQVE